MRITVKNVFYDGTQQAEVSCVSTESKPTEKIAAGSTLREIDTGKVFYFNEAESLWVEQSANSGGGSGADIVTIDIDTSYPALGEFMLDEFSSAIETLVANAGEMMAFPFAPESETDAESELSSLVNTVTSARNAGKIVRGIFLGTLMDVTASGNSSFSFSINYFLGTPAPGEVRVNVHFTSIAQKAYVIGTYAGFSNNS